MIDQLHEDFDFMNRFDINNYVYGYANSETKDRKLVYFKIIGIEDNKLSLVRVASKIASLDCRIPTNKKMEQTVYISTVNRRNGVFKVKYKYGSIILSRWDGEPKFSK